MVVRVETTLRLVNDSQPQSEGWWNWSVWVDGSPEDLAEIDSVTYRLHPTFPNPVVKIRDRSTNFKLASVGWGEFAIAADVTMKDGRTVRLERWLELGPEAGSKSAPRAAKPRPSVFLSHSIADKEIVAALSEVLEQHGVEVRTAEQLLETGDETAPELGKHLQDSDAVVALFSNPPSRWLEQEAVMALKKGTYVVPVLIAGATISSELSGVPRYELANVDFVDGLAQQIAARVKDHAIPDEEVV
jgi:transcription initiation factor IIF auxiliary subunit